MRTEPFTIAVADDDIDDLHRRLRHTRWPDALDGEGWDAGTDLAFLRRLTDHWLSGFDWRAREARLNELPQITAELDGLDVHVVHRRGTGPDPYPLVITHGWPGTGFDMERIVPLLADPGAHGADPADAFHVVAPSLPGHGFSQRPDRPGFGPHRVSAMWRELMTGLGYDRFGVQGHDWGAAVGMWLAQRFPDDVAGLHVTFVPGSYRPPLDGGPLTPEEERFVADLTTWFDAEGGYHHLHRTKPQTPAYGLTDSPAGLAAWIVEKMRAWSDCDGDVESAFGLDDLLTRISLYWFTATIGSSMRFYRENGLHPTSFAPGERVVPPLGVAVYPHDPVMPPRSWLDRVFDVTRWTAMPRGGHFGAMEDPERLAEEIRAFFRPLRR